LVEAGSKRILEEAERDLAVENILEELEADYSDDKKASEKFLPKGVQA
jgi:hypothetical protein